MIIFGYEIKKIKNKKINETPEKLPDIGDVYYLKSSLKSGNPFHNHKIIEVKVLNVKEGWVEYGFAPHYSIPYALEMELFLDLYQAKKV